MKQIRLGVENAPLSSLEPCKLVTESLWTSVTKPVDLRSFGPSSAGCKPRADHPASVPWPSAFTTTGEQGGGSQAPPESAHAQGHLAHVGKGCSWWTGHLLLLSACQPPGLQPPRDAKGLPFAHHLASQASSLLLTRFPKAPLSRWASHSRPDGPALQSSAVLSGRTKLTQTCREVNTVGSPFKRTS